MNRVPQGDSPAEEKFERWRGWIGLGAGPALAFLTFLWTGGFPREQRALAAVLVWAGVYWVTEAIPLAVTALLGPALAALVGVGSAREVLAPFADPIIFVFLGSFLLARAMSVNGLDRRVALGLLHSRLANSPLRLLVATGVAAGVISMWISNTATTAILFPIVLGVIATLEPEPPGHRYATGLLLMTAYAASVGGLATPVGTPPNLIGIGMIENLANTQVPFFLWVVLNLPLTVTAIGALCLLLWWHHHPTPSGRKAFVARATPLRTDLPPWSRAGTVTLIAFLVTVVLWLLPGFVAVAVGTDHPAYEWINQRLHEGVAALLGAALLFLIPIQWSKPKAALSWREAAQIDWGTILLFGGGLSLGRLMYETGLAERLARAALEASGITSLWGITAAAIAFAIALSETTSNTASASMVVPVSIAVAQAAGVSPLPPALGATLGASFGFMLPVSTPPNAIVYASRQIPLLSMLRAGILLDLVGFALIWLNLRVLCPILGLR